VPSLQHETAVDLSTLRLSTRYRDSADRGQSGRYRTNVWDYPRGDSFGAERDPELSLHRTVKPVALVADAICDCSKRGGLVLDPCAGAGTTLIAAEKNGRRAAASELDPLYVDTATRRRQKVTGKKAILADAEVSFADTGRCRMQSAAAMPRTITREDRR
jgi:DNA modification methylase